VVGSCSLKIFVQNNEHERKRASRRPHQPQT
jgi:hypothetical protein